MNGCCRGTRDFASSCRGTARFHVAVYRDSATYRDRTMCKGTARCAGTARYAKGLRDVQRDRTETSPVVAIIKGSRPVTVKERTHVAGQFVRVFILVVRFLAGLDWCAASNLSACRRRMHRISMNDHAH